MKRFLAIMFTLIMAVTALTGCGTDPVAADFEKFLNVDMVDVNAKYEEIKAESAKWETMESDAELLASAKNDILPKINETIAMLAEIEPATDEVKAVKGKYESVINTYKEGFELLVNALESGDENVVNEGSAKLEEAFGLLDEYNAALEELAAEFDMEIEY